MSSEDHDKPGPIPPGTIPSGTIPDSDRRTVAERRVRRTPPDEKGMIRNDSYTGPDRRRSADRREYQERQRHRIRKEKMAFLNRTTLSVGAGFAAVMYAVVFLLAPEIRDMNEGAARMKEMEARMNEMNQQLAAQQKAAQEQAASHSSLGGALSRHLGAAEDAVNAAVDTVGDAAAAAAAVAAPAAGVEDLLQLLSGVQALGRTKKGDAALGLAVAKLKTAVALANGDPSSLNAAVSLARNQDPTLGALFSHIDDDHLGAAALLLSLDDLRRRIARQEPFADDLALVSSIAGNDPAVKAALGRLVPYALSGIAGQGALQGMLADSAAAIVTAGAPEGEEGDDSLKGQALRRLSQFVKVRRAGEIEGNDAAAAVARARLDLGKGDLRTAVLEMQQLKGPAAVQAAPWVIAAKGAIAADESTDLLSQTILQVLTAASAGKGFTLQTLVDMLKANLTVPLDGAAAGSPDSVPYMSPAMLEHGGDSAKIAPYDGK